MATYRPTVLARVPRLLLDRARELGVERSRLMAASGLSLQELKDPDGRVPAGKIWKLWQELIHQVPDESLGLKLGDTLESPSRFGLVGYTLLHSRTLRQALDRLARYSRIVSETIRIAVEDQADRSRVLLESDPQFELLRQPIDSRLASIVSAMRNLSGKPIAPLEVELPYQKLADASPHRRFFRAPLRFSRSRAALWFRRTDLELPVVQADETLAGYLDRLAEEQLRGIGSGSLTERVGRVIWSELSGGIPSIQRVASLVGVSPRTLQRHLRQEGKPFRAVLESFRREMATRLMDHRRLAVYEVAFLLGYADPSSFHRAFRRWYRTSPRAYRRRAS